MQKFLILLVGIFIGNALMNFSSSKIDALDSPEKLKNSFVGEFMQEGDKNSDSLKDQNKNAAIKAKAAPAPQMKSVKIQNGISPDEVEAEISNYFGEGSENDDIDMGSAYRAEIRNESRKLQKKLIRQ